MDSWTLGASCGFELLGFRNWVLHESLFHCSSQMNPQIKMWGLWRPVQHPEFFYCFIGSGKWQVFFSRLVVPAIRETGCAWAAVMGTWRNSLRFTEGSTKRVVQRKHKRCMWWYKVSWRAVRQSESYNSFIRKTHFYRLASEFLPAVNSAASFLWLVVDLCAL